MAKKKNSETSESTNDITPRSSVLITGAAGYVGSLLTRRLAENPGALTTIVATDVKEVPADEQLPNVIYRALDIRSDELSTLIAENKVDTVVHLATVVTPGPNMSRELMYDIDVNGTRKLIDACIEHGVKKLIVTSSGAAYGYYADNSPLLTEECPIRGNEAFAYSYHKRLVENMLAEFRQSHPELKQLIFRPGTILGKSVQNQITNLFEKPVVTGVKGASTPFVMIWDEDVVNVLVEGVRNEKSGIYNLAGDGVLTLREIATILGKRYIAIPPALLTGALKALKLVELTQYGPEQIDFLRYRPVLSNEALKRDFGYRPKLSTREVFELYRAHNPRLKSGPFDFLSPQYDLDGKVVLITGAAGGIGRAMARRFAAEGARLALLDVDHNGLVALQRQLETEGAETVIKSCDLRSEADAQQAIEEVIGHFGGIDVLVNNAGITHRSLLSDTDPGVIRRVMEVNFFGSVHCTRAALDSIVERQGVIVGITSVAGFAPLVGRTGYCASKHAMHGFFDSLRAEVRDKGVTVALVCPAFTDTPIEENALSGSGGKIGNKRAIVGQMAPPESVSDALVEGIMRREERIVPHRVGKAAWWISRIAPSVYERAMRRTQRDAFQL